MKMEYLKLERLVENIPAAWLRNTKEDSGPRKDITLQRWDLLKSAVWRVKEAYELPTNNPDRGMLLRTAVRNYRTSSAYFREMGLDELGILDQEMTKPLEMYPAD